MNPQRFARVKEVLLTALAYRPEERQAYLREACAGDPELQAEVEELLKRKGRTAPEVRTGALADLAARALAEAGQVDLRVHLPDRIGPYRILGILGEGGMGLVYRALQEAPVRREVALKVMRTSADSPAILARFESERQTLAQMDHPNIARLLDAASNGDGRPFFVMELVRGAPLTEYCREAKVDHRGRLRLFADVCRAVRHAHRSGIIHRDLKPSNILVTMVHDQPVPKVIDFSIAKAVRSEAAGADDRTRTGQIVGTLEYMSPEQARGAVRAIDTRTDVYALGVILYELLADRLPHDLTDQPLHQAVERIVNEPVPSLRRAATTATGRVDADLDTLVHKCLEKAPDRRYGSAAELVEDLERYLDSRPIRARPASTLYQWRKLVARNRAVFAVGALTFAFLMIFSITVTVQLGVQRRERARAEKAAADARQAAARAESINAFLQSLLASAAPGNMGKDVTVRQVLDKAAAGMESSLAEEPEARADAFQTIGTTYGSLADMKASVKYREKALEIRRKLHPGDHVIVARAMAELALDYAYMPGRQQEAYALGVDGIAMWRRLVPRPDPDLADALVELAWRLGGPMGRMGRVERERMARQGIAMREALGRVDEARMGKSLGTLGLILREAGKISEAETDLRKSCEMLERALGPVHPETVNSRNDLGVTLMYLPDKDEEAYGLIRDALAQNRKILGPDHLSTACSTRNLAIWMLRHEELDEARPLLEEERRIWRGIFGAVGFDQAQAADLLAWIPHARGEYAAAEAGYREMISQYERSDIAPVGEHALDYALLLHTVGGRDREGEMLLREALDRDRKSSSDPAPITARMESALGCIALDAGRLAEAEEHLSFVRKHLSTIEDEEGCLAPQNAAVLARLRALQGRARESDALFGEVAGRLAYCVPRHPKEWRHLLPVTAAFHESRGNRPEARRYRDALARLDRIARGEIKDWWKEGVGEARAAR